MSEELHPVINVMVAPKKVSMGQMLSIHAYIQDRKTGVPMAFENIYLQIIDEDGIEYWPQSTVEEDSASISKLISTQGMKSGNYRVRVSLSRKMRPMGEATFEIDNRLIPTNLLVPGLLLIPPLLLDKEDLVEPEDPGVKIAWLVYRTQLDSRVCQYCSPHEGKRYRPSNPDLPKIPIHFSCRCHYDIISKEKEKELYQAMWTYSNIMESMKQAELIDAYNANQAARIMWSN